MKCPEECEVKNVHVRRVGGLADQSDLPAIILWFGQFGEVLEELRIVHQGVGRSVFLAYRDVFYVSGRPLSDDGRHNIVHVPETCDVLGDLDCVHFHCAGGSVLRASLSWDSLDEWSDLDETVPPSFFGAVIPWSSNGCGEHHLLNVALVFAASVGRCFVRGDVVVGSGLRHEEPLFVDVHNVEKRTEQSARWVDEGE